MLALLSGCAADHRAQISAPQEAAQYRAHARADYTPPGPPEDPWGPYITEAAVRFDLPERWVRQVIRTESGGKQYHGGVLTVSPVGAMGLMQLMPQTYDEVAARYNLGDDPYDPHNNILAGTAYLREMYDAFGSPGFLAAYNGGPSRLEGYLTNNRPLPLETRRYVAMIAPAIAGVYPNVRSPAEQLAVNYLPTNIPAGPRYPRHTAYALAARDRRAHQANVRYAMADRRGGAHTPPPHPVISPANSAMEVAEAPDPRPIRGSKSRLNFIGTAQASEAVPHDTGHGWGVQVGAFGDAGQARTAAGHAQGVVGHAQPMVASVHSHGTTLYRARLLGLTRNDAEAACQKLSHGHGSCVVVSPATEN